MASIKPHKDGWRAFIFKQGVRKSKVFLTKAAANTWARIQETDIEDGVLGKLPNKTFGDLLTRYLEEESIKKRGEAWERIRINNTNKMPLANVKLAELSAKDAAKWRDTRAKVVSDGTVLREWNLLSHACNVAIKEWGWLKNNPFKEVRRPKSPEARSRRISDDEIKRILEALGYDGNPINISSRVGAAFLFSIETAMRAGEVCNLLWKQVFERHVHIAMSKNGTKRDVPLSKAAKQILENLPRESVHVFNLKSSQIDSLFRKAKSKALIDDLHWHDTRHEAISRLSHNGYDVMQLAKIVGIKDLRILQNVYYNPTIDELADKMQ